MYDVGDLVKAKVTQVMRIVSSKDAVSGLFLAAPSLCFTACYVRVVAALHGS